MIEVKADPTQKSESTVVGAGHAHECLNVNHTAFDTDRDAQRRLLRRV